MEWIIILTVFIWIASIIYFSEEENKVPEKAVIKIEPVIQDQIIVAKKKNGITPEQVMEKMCLPGKPRKGFTWDQMWKENDPELLNKSLSSLVVPLRCPHCNLQVQMLELKISLSKSLTTFACPRGHGWGATVD